MGRLYLIQLDGRFYSCRRCRSHLANCDELLSKVMPLPPVGAAHVLFLWFTWFFVDMAWCNGFCGQVSLPAFS
jgi:hypothetical protein